MKDKSRIILEEGICEDVLGHYGKDHKFFDSSKYAEGYCNFCCMFDFDEKGICERYRIIE